MNDCTPIRLRRIGTGIANIQKGKERTSMRSVTSTILAVLATCLIAGTVHALDVPKSARERVDRQCLPTQHREGANAYRQCVTDELARTGESSPDLMSSLSLDEQYIVQVTCGGTTDTACVAEQLESLSAESTVSLAALNSDERLVLSNTCLRSNDNVVNYRRCVNEQVRRLVSLPRPALDTLGLLERNALELSCGSDSADLLSYRQCLVEMTGAIANTVATTDGEGAINGESPARPFESADNDSINAARVATSDYLDLGSGEQLPATADDVVTDAELGTAPDETNALPGTAQPETQTTSSTTVIQRLRDARARLVTTFQNLDKVGQSVLAAAVVLPLLLVGLWALMRSRSDEDYEDDLAYEGAEPDFRNDPDLGLPYDDDESYDDFEAPARSTSQPALASEFVDDEGPATQFARPLTSAERGAQQPSLEREVDLDLEDNVTRLAPKPDFDLSENKPKVDGFAWHSAFGEWLSKQPPQSRLQSVIELFIYWIAYGDDRYDEQMRQSVMNEPNPDAHDLIKRWVLDADAYALADAISWMQTFSSRPERCQTLDLLMTLLVTDGAITPVQNTLLRFLTDAFGLGEAELDLQYSRAFGEPLPALPRVDKPNWWAQQDQVRMERWDALGLLLRPDEEQFRIRLGLSLAGELDHQDINDAYRRAARRCQPERFDALGQRELALVKRQLDILNKAREGLLGVNA